MLKIKTIGNEGKDGSGYVAMTLKIMSDDKSLSQE